ncbi:dihydropteroate synthase [Deltaproteobacteria bacterium Smac51]|nr:dihydropteroate synthase [Deltaproteobacteria bacterium Smac51]
MTKAVCTDSVDKSTLPARLAWKTAAGEWSLDFTKTVIMAIINLTPDSFSDGGRFSGPEEAVNAALAEEEAGAHIFDLGAESTRPGSARVSEQEEWSRLEPVLRGLAAKSKLPVSIDTYRAGVAEKAILAGAAIINDIYAGRKEPRILEVAAKHGVPIVLMHMQGDPDNMQVNPHYDDVVTEVHDFLLERARAAEAAGILPELIILDPGIGFGKNQGHNLTLIKHFEQAMPKGYRSLMALSRKAFLGRILGGAEPADRDLATATANALAIIKGADMIRVHDVRPNREAAEVANAVLAAV